MFYLQEFFQVFGEANSYNVTLFYHRIIGRRWKFQILNSTCQTLSKHVKHNICCIIGKTKFCIEYILAILYFHSNITFQNNWKIECHVNCIKIACLLNSCKDNKTMHIESVLILNKQKYQH